MFIFLQKIMSLHPADFADGFHNTHSFSFNFEGKDANCDTSRELVYVQKRSGRIPPLSCLSVQGTHLFYLQAFWPSPEGFVLTHILKEGA